MVVSQLIEIITQSLSPKFLKLEYRKLNVGNPMYGHCYVATEVLYCLMNRFELTGKFKPFQAKDDNNISHWWLQNDIGEIHDITASQYTSVGKSPPYANGKHRHFMYPSPSKRSRKVMENVIKKLIS